jgi:DNA-nicking Smr family endonuclease
VLREKTGPARDRSTPPGAGGSARLERRLRAEDAIPARLDLHGCDRGVALERLRAFLGEVARCSPPPELVLVIHGKGERVLARTVRDALDADPRVAEHVAAPRRLGGEGARVARIRLRGGGSRRR